MSRHEQYQRVFRDDETNRMKEPDAGEQIVEFTANSTAIECHDEHEFEDTVRTPVKPRFGLQRPFQKINQDDEDHDGDAVRDDHRNDTNLMEIASNGNMAMMNDNDVESSTRITECASAHDVSDSDDGDGDSDSCSLHSVKSGPSNNNNGMSKKRSFDLDDDEDDELRRYAFNFEQDSTRLRTVSSDAGNMASLEEGLQMLTSPWSKQKVGANTLNGRNETDCAFCMALHIFWDAFQTARIESRRQRAQRMLTLGDDRGMERFLINFFSWFDLTDRGIILLPVIFLFWILASVTLPGARLRILFIGIPLWMFRFLWRPAYWYVWGRRIEEKRQANIELYDQLNLHAVGSPMASETTRSIAPPGNGEERSLDVFDDQEVVNDVSDQPWSSHQLFMDEL